VPHGVTGAAGISSGVMAADPHGTFRAAVGKSRLVDPMPTLRNLAEATATSVDDVVHHALVRFASSGSEALLFIGPDILKELTDARYAEDWRKVAGIIDWLQAGWERYSSH
jgi:hypothetical protein